jgi:hypothetical protein
MVRRNMAKIHHALTNMRTVLNGLTRGLPLEVIDRGYGEQSGAAVSYFPTTQALGLVMPSNSPCGEFLWLPAIALKTPVIIKPGREEPWTPYRLIQAFIAAGAPPEAFGFYPTDHEGAGEVMKICGRALIFGDAGRWRSIATIRSFPSTDLASARSSSAKIRSTAGLISSTLWRPRFAENGGRSCINASAVVVPRFGKEIADALAQKARPRRASRTHRRTGEALRLCESQDGGVHRQRHRIGSADPRRRRRDGEISQRSAQGRV